LRGKLRPSRDKMRQYSAALLQLLSQIRPFTIKREYMPCGLDLLRQRYRAE
jgi:hypothetical protein